MVDAKIPVSFYKNQTGEEPVREWLREQEKDDKKTIGGAIRTVQCDWPVGMPLVRSIQGYQGLWEIRHSISQGRIARVFFCIEEAHIVLLHAFIKKAQKTPLAELKKAWKRKKEVTTNAQQRKK